MAAVCMATHRNGSRSAIRILHPFGRPELERLFVEEGWIANRVEHPAVVRVMDDDVTEDGCPFLVMDLVAATSLDERAEEAGERCPRAT